MTSISALLLQNDAANAALGGGLAAIGGMMLLFWLAIVVVAIVGMWKVFTKAGQPGWACIIPIYGTLVLLRIIGKPWWWLLMMIIPFVNIIYAIWAVNLLSKSFGKSEGYTVGMIFLPFIFYPMLGFGSAEYQGAQSSEARRERDMNSI